jgi:uncharacterized membrane protein YgcG
MRFTGTMLPVVAMFLTGMTQACTTSSATTTQQDLTQNGCTVNAPDPRACDPADTHKTTICHIPPGNPANAHTLCVGTPSVPAHLDHGDFVGTCSCAGDGSDGSGGSGGSGGGGSGSDTGSGSAGSDSGTGIL